jgi:5'-3' exonuclease
MGIPSYFRHILSKFPKLLSGAAAAPKGDVLLVDFNCLIYGCIHDPAMPAYSHDTRLEWEGALIRTIEAYVNTLWTTAGKPAQILLAVDGVVPMAKIRQQRLRRFKSVWLAEKEREVLAAARPLEQWDTNSITPGTEFMERLSVALKSLCGRRSVGWIASGAEEAGEGEQKLMAWIRAQPAGALDGKHIIVYGLDADLIVLCLLHLTTTAPKSKWSILRETKEFGSAATEPFLILDVNGLLEVLFPRAATRKREILDYVCGMSLLGNDFLPHSLSVTIRGGGHDRLCAELDRLHSKSQYLTFEEAGTCRVLIQPESLSEILYNWSETERDDIGRAFDKKYAMRAFPPKTELERKMLPVQNLPIEWRQEYTMWNRGSGQLLDEWELTYYGDLGAQDIREQCSTYVKGLQWILDYYTGAPVSYEWMYVWIHPPLWKDLDAYVAGQVALPLPPTDGAAVKPQEQLSLVLPLESWWLIRDHRLKAMPSKIPVFWPKSYEFHSLGKRWLWECYPSIPIITPKRLRHYLGRLPRP